MYTPQNITNGWEYVQYEKECMIKYKKEKLNSEFNISLPTTNYTPLPKQKFKANYRMSDLNSFKKFKLPIAKRLIAKNIYPTVNKKEISTLLSNITNISSGDFGTVFSSEFENRKVAIKVFNIGTLLYEMSHEDTWLNDIFMSMLVVNGLRNFIPNFVYTFASFYCKDCDVAPNSFINNKRGEVMIISEFIEGETLSKFMEKHNPEEVYSVYYHILLIIRLAQILIDFTHWDLHTKNILIQTLPEPQTFCYTIENKDYLITTKYIPVIIDYGYMYAKHNDVGVGKVNTDTGFYFDDRVDFHQVTVNVCSKKGNFGIENVRKLNKRNINLTYKYQKYYPNAHDCLSMILPPKNVYVRMSINTWFPNTIVDNTINKKVMEMIKGNLIFDNPNNLPYKMVINNITIPEIITYYMESFKNISNVMEAIEFYSDDVVDQQLLIMLKNGITNSNLPIDPPLLLFHRNKGIYIRMKYFVLINKIFTKNYFEKR